jgi:hypothetical protein
VLDFPNTPAVNDLFTLTDGTQWKWDGVKWGPATGSSSSNVVTSFNTRVGTVTLLAADVTGAGGALLAGPVFSGDPQAPTPAATDNDNSIATTAFVTNAVAGAGVMISDTAPAVPRNGQLWWDSADAQLYVRYLDPTGPAQWVAASNSGVGAGGLTQAQADARYLQLIGGNLTGPLTLAADPGGALQAATKQYVDNHYLPLAGGTLTGALTLPANAASGLQAVPLQQLNGTVANYLPLSGGTLTGVLNITPAAGSWPTLQMYASAGMGHQMLFFTGGNLRWGFNPGDNTAEGGGNAGSDLNFVNYSDTGAYLGAPLTIKRSNAQALFSGTIITTAGHVVSQAATNPTFCSFNTNVGYACGFFCGTGPYLYFGNMDGSGNYIGPVFASWDTASNFITNAAASKPGGGSWSNSSDARIKTVLGDYASGLEAVLALHPVRYRYKDNWRRPNEDLDEGPHSQVAAAGQEFIGLVAQEAEIPMPEMVTLQAAVIDGVPVDDMRILDNTALSYALVNAIKELNARLASLETQVRLH